MQGQDHLYNTPKIALAFLTLIPVSVELSFLEAAWHDVIITLMTNRRFACLVLHFLEFSQVVYLVYEYKYMHFWRLTVSSQYSYLHLYLLNFL